MPPIDEVDATLGQRFLGAAEHGLGDFDPGVRVLPIEGGEALEQQPGREDDVDGEPDLGLPAAREFGGRALDSRRLLDERLAAAIEHLSGGRQHRLAAAQLEHLHAEQFLELLDRVGHRRLRAVQAFRRLRVAAGLDHGDERAPLVQRDFGQRHISIQSIDWR